MNRFQKPVLMDRQPHLFCANQGNVRRKGRANLALKSLHRPTGQIGVQKLVCIARRYVFKINVFHTAGILEYIVRHFPQRIHYFTILLYFLIAQTVLGISEPLCSRTSDKKDTTPGRMKVCANIPVGGRVYKIIIRIDPKKARKNRPNGAHGYAQKRCLPICTMSGRDQIHLLVAVTGLK